MSPCCACATSLLPRLRPEASEPNDHDMAGAGAGLGRAGRTRRGQTADGTGGRPGEMDGSPVAVWLLSQHRAGAMR